MRATIQARQTTAEIVFPEKTLKRIAELDPDSQAAWAYNAIQKCRKCGQEIHAIFGDGENSGRILLREGRAPDEGAT